MIKNLPPRRHATTPVLLLAVIIAIVVSLPLAAQDLAFVPEDSQVYALLEQAWAKGYIAYLPQMRPYTKRLVYRLVDEMKAAGAPSALSDRLAEALEHKPVGLGVDTSWDGGRLVFNHYPDLQAAWNASSPSDLEAGGSWMFDLGLGYGDDLFLGVHQDFSLDYWSWATRPYPSYLVPASADMNMYTWDLTTGSAGFNHTMTHVAGNADVSIHGSTEMQFTIGLPFGSVQVGRQSLDWGPSDTANLVLSRTAKPYEFAGYSFDIADRGTFMWVTGVLRPFEFSRDSEYNLVTAHRIEYMLAPWLLFAIHESIVYDYRFELSYLNPLTLYYITEVNNGDQDNKLGGIDLVARLPDTKLYMSLLGDDWDLGQLFNFSYFHNLWALVLGVKNYSLDGLSLGAEYVHASHWMYTHWTGNNYTNWDTHLGHTIEPNSHLFSVDASWDASQGLNFGFTGRFGQHGRGDVDTPADWGAEAALYGVSLGDLFYSFLDAGVLDIPVETFWDATLSVSAQVRALRSVPFTVEAGWTLSRTFNRGNVAGADFWDNYFSLAIRL